MRVSWFIVLLIASVMPALLVAVEVKPEEMADAGQFMSGCFGQETYAEPVFSFLYDGKPSQELLKSWTFKKETFWQDEFRKQTILTYTDPATKLEIKCVAVQWLNFPVVEWTVYLKNTSGVKTPIIKDLRAIDILLNHPEKESVVLHSIRGDSNSMRSFEVRQNEMGVGAELKFAPIGGRPTNGEWPYYNFKMSDKGVMMAVGWPGQWSSCFNRDAAGLRLNAGQELTYFVLLPGEEVRTPLIAMLFYRGDWIGGQNLWRQWMICHNTPQRNGKRLTPPHLTACSSWQFSEMEKANEQNQKDFIDGYLKRGIKLDYWWMDAGWYVGACEKGWYRAVGTWDVDKAPDRFPNGLRPISDYAHSKGVDIVVWFEPERVHAGTWLAENHPEWILGGKDGGLLNLGHPDAWQWLVNHIDTMIADEGIDLYRQDFNMDPLRYWRSNDAEDRQGITENKHVTRYLAYWDELQRRHPGMLIDSCASGGRRNDLETMRRAVPLLRSDYVWEPVGNQGQTYGLSLWLPFYGAGFTSPKDYSAYSHRSLMCPHQTMIYDVRADLDDNLLIKLYREWLDVAPYFYGDFYPLTSWNLSETDWIAWQFNQTGIGGFVSAFRRSQCHFLSARFRLSGLDPDAEYRIENTDTTESMIRTGNELMEKGLLIKIPEQPGAVIVKYTAVK